MMSNSYQNVCLSSPESDTWSEETLKLPPPMSLLESCCQEMEKKGLRLFPRYQNFPAVSHKTQAPESCLESWNHGHSTNMKNMQEFPPILCVGQFTTSAEVHSINLIDKQAISRHSTERDLSEFHDKEGSDSEQGNSRTHPLSLVMGTEKSKPAANQEIAKPDREQPTSSLEEDALSIYEVYTL